MMVVDHRGWTAVHGTGSHGPTGEADRRRPDFPHNIEFRAENFQLSKAMTSPWASAQLVLGLCLRGLGLSSGAVFAEHGVAGHLGVPIMTQPETTGGSQFSATKL